MPDPLGAPYATSKLPTHYVAIIVMLAVIAVAIASYLLITTQPLGRVEVILLNDTAWSGFTVHVGIYFDGELKDVVYIEPGESYTHGYMLTRGTHTVGFDYSYQSGSLDIDGVVEVQQSFDLMLLQPTTVSYILLP